MRKWMRGNTNSAPRSGNTKGRWWHYRCSTFCSQPIYKNMPARTLKVRFSQPSDINHPFELCPFIDLQDTAEELRDVLDGIATERFDTVDDALSAMEKVEPNFPKRSKQASQLFRNVMARWPPNWNDSSWLQCSETRSVLGEIMKA